jgi:hypothetical protein
MYLTDYKAKYMPFKQIMNEGGKGNVCKMLLNRQHEWR